MTYTTRTLTWNAAQQAEEAKETSAGENTADRSIMEGNVVEGNAVEGNIHELFSICSSLNNLCETLSRLESAIRRKNIEINIAQRRQEGSL